MESACEIMVYLGHFQYRQILSFRVWWLCLLAILWVYCLIQSVEDFLLLLIVDIGIFMFFRIDLYLVFQMFSYSPRTHSSQGPYSTARSFGSTSSRVSPGGRRRRRL